jgi:hypothetical protein
MDTSINAGISSINDLTTGALFGSLNDITPVHVPVGSASAVVDIGNRSRVTILTNTNVGITNTVKWSHDGSNFYKDSNSFFLMDSNNWANHFTTGARYIQVVTGGTDASLSMLVSAKYN